MNEISATVLPILHRDNHPTPQELGRCSLLLLPPEIRNIIYRLLLTSPSLFHLRRLIVLNHCSPYVLPPLPLSPQILVTCRQINDEAGAILYAENTFTAHTSLLTSLPYIVTPTKPIREPGLGKRIRKWYINVRLDCDPRYREDEVTDAFTGCEELEVEAREAMFRTAGTGVLMLFKAVRGVSKARVHGSVVDSFARWLEGSMMSHVGAEVEPYDAERYEPRDYIVMESQQTRQITTISPGVSHELSPAHAFDGRANASLHTLSSTASLVALPLELRRNIFSSMLDAINPHKPNAKSIFTELIITTKLLGPLLYDETAVRTWTYKNYHELRAQCATPPIYPPWSSARYAADTTTPEDNERRREFLEAVFSPEKARAMVEHVPSIQAYLQARGFLHFRCQCIRSRFAQWDAVVEGFDTGGQQSQWPLLANAVFDMGRFVGACALHEQLPGVREVAMLVMGSSGTFASSDQGLSSRLSALGRMEFTVLG